SLVDRRAGGGGRDRRRGGVHHAWRGAGQRAGRRVRAERRQPRAAQPARGGVDLRGRAAHRDEDPRHPERASGGDHREAAHRPRGISAGVAGDGPVLWSAPDADLSARAHASQERSMTKTNRTRLEVVPPSEPVPASPARSGGCAAWFANAQLEHVLSNLDDQALGQASRTFEELVNRQREQLVSEVKVLADDNRIRATVLAPKFDEATVQDVLEDLRKSSGASLLAVLDATGKVQAVTGAVGLKQVDLSGSTAVRAAFE